MDRLNNTNPILPGAGVPRNQDAADTHACPRVGPYDGAPSNPPGRGAADGRRETAAMQRCKRPLKLATFNIQTLTAPSDGDGAEKRLKTEELAWNLKRQGIEICGIQEHRLVHTTEREKEVNRHSTDSGYELLTASAWRNSAQAANGGVGLVIGKVAQKLLTKVDYISGRLLRASFQGNPVLTVIVAYAPCEYAEAAEKSLFYNQLHQAIETTPLHNFLAITGDFNARLGKEDALFTINTLTNDNGRRMLEILEDHDLLATNTLFQKKEGKLWTWMSPRSTAHQIDYILTRKKWRKSVLNSEAYGSFSTLGSDHRVVAATVRLSLRAPRKQGDKKPRYNWKELAESTELQEMYAVEVRNRFDTLQNESEDITARYQHFTEANQGAAEACLQKIPRQKKKERSLNPRVTEARAEMREAYRAYMCDRDNDGKRGEYRLKKAGLYQVYATLEQEELAHKIKEVEQADASHRHAQSWKLINDISGRNASQTARVQGESPEERVQSWYQHFKSLLGSPVTAQLEEEEEPINTLFQNLPIPEGPFTMEEYLKAKSSIRCGKSCGEDGVTPEVLKHVQVDDIVLGIINEAYESGEIPEAWKSINIVPIPKSGDLTKTDNYRGIALSSITAKTYNRLILNRLRPVLDPLLRDGQNGFRQKRTTVGQILALRRLLEGIRDRRLTAVITFIDFKKAFDTVDRGKLVAILEAYGVPSTLVKAISATYAQTHAKVLSPDGETEAFDIHAGVLQGDTLAPFLFIVALDYALRKAIDGKEEELGFTLVPRKSRRVGPAMVTDLDFADDIALVSDTVEKARRLLISVEEECAKIGLHLNAKKTKVMAYNSPDTAVTTAEGSTLEVVPDFKYLGAWIASTEKDIRTRKALAWTALHSMRKVWKSRMGNNLKRRLFVSTVESVLLYGAETWTLTTQQERALDGTYTRMLRMALNTTWRDHPRNCDLYDALPRVTEKIRERRLKLAGHCIRHPELAASHMVLWEPKQGATTRGKKPTTYPWVLLRDTGLANTSELRTLMEDRSEWRRVVQRARVGDG